MKITSKLLTSLLAVMTLTTAPISVLAQGNNPAEITKEVTGQSAEEIYTRRQQGVTYGTIAKEAGKLVEFQNQKLELAKNNLQNKVNQGQMTQEQANQMIDNMKQNQANCDQSGTGQNLRINQNSGNKNGGSGNKNGGNTNGTGRQGGGQNLKLKDGSCLNVQ